MLLLPCLISLHQAHVPIAKLLQWLAAKVSFLQPSAEDRPW